jgi:hypothetical protein
MENKFYALILLFLLSGVLPARSQDTTTCNARFYVSYDGNTVYFRAADSITGVQHFWSFGDGTQVGYGNYVSVTHNYSGQGSYPVTHLVRNTATSCYDSSTQVITIAPPPGCSINFYYSHDGTRANTPYYFYATPYLAGATHDTVSWTINDTLVGTGDSLQRFLASPTWDAAAKSVSRSMWGIRYNRRRLAVVSTSIIFMTAQGPIHRIIFMPPPIWPVRRMTP